MIKSSNIQANIITTIKPEPLSYQFPYYPTSYYLLKQSIIINSNMLRKNQLKKMTLDEIMHHLASETDSDSIKLITSFIAEKNSALSDKKTAILNDIAETRRKVEKSIKNLNGRVKDRIDKKETIVMDKDSRPNTENITDLMALYSYLEAQGQIISRNNNSIKEVAERTVERQGKLKSQIDQRLSFQELDRKFQELNAQCKKEQVVRDALLKDRNERRAHYANIQQSIEQYRRQYQKVQVQIRQKERQLIQLVGYYQARLSQDNSLLQQLPAMAQTYEQQLLATQSQLNACFSTLNERKILQIQLLNSAQ